MSWLGLVVTLSTGICIDILSRFEVISQGIFRFDTRVDLIVIVILLAIIIFLTSFQDLLPITVWI